ncbi:MAG: hypothetical protein H3Z51_01555 [archaeon]|nr:hypothetical protein [archaeon]
MPVIKVSEETKKVLDEIKIHPRETYEDVIKRLIEEHKMIKEGERAYGE